MMKNFKLSLLFALPMFIISACSNHNNSSSIESSSSSEIVETQYEDTPTIPTYDYYPKSFEGYRTYYFDGTNGNDNNDGLSEVSAKKTLSALPNIVTRFGKEYPLRILLKRGTSFQGNIVLGGYNASNDKPFVFKDYGDADTLPKINGVGSDTSILTNFVIRIEESNTIVENIEVTGPTCTRGIYILSRVGGIYENIVVRGCYVHDLNWNWTETTSPEETNPADIDPENVTPVRSVLRYRRLYGGIEIFNGTADSGASVNTGPIVYKNVFIEKNRVERVSHVGINVYNYWVNRGGIGYGYNKYVPDDPNYQNFSNGVGYFPFENLVVKDNYVSCVGGDGVIVDGTDNAYLISNTCYKASYLGRSGQWNAGIWVHNCRDAWMMYNEAAYTYLQHGAGDGEGYDIDNSCERVRVYYNYAHHNQGGGLLLCNNASELLVYKKDGSLVSTTKSRILGPWNNNVVRNNVFAFNGIASNPSRSGFITVARTCDGVVVENNTVVLDPSIQGQSIINCEDTMVSKEQIYRNNIFYCSSEASKPIFSNQTLSSPLFDGNLYFNIADGNSLENQLVLSDDQHGVTNVSVSFDLSGNYDGFNNVTKFVPGQNLSSFAQKLPIQLRKDLNNNSTETINYLGAFVKQ